jgi:hypothetical protein
MRDKSTARQIHCATTSTARQHPLRDKIHCATNPLRDKSFARQSALQQRIEILQRAVANGNGTNK